MPVVVSLALITFLFWFFVTSFGMLPEKYMPHGTSLRSSCHIQRAHDTHRHRHRHTDTAHTQRTKDDGHERCTNDTVPYSLFYLQCASECRRFVPVVTRCLAEAQFKSDEIARTLAKLDSTQTITAVSYLASDVRVALICTHEQTYITNACLNHTATKRN